MKPRDRVKVDWTPETALRSFECRIMADSPNTPAKTYAVTVRAMDVNGDEVTPVSDSWRHSKGLGAHYCYNSASDSSGTMAIKTWHGDTYLERIEVEVVAWVRGNDSPDINGVAFSPASEDTNEAAVWTLVRPRVLNTPKQEVPQ